MTQREALKKNKQIKNSVRIMLCTAGEWLIDSVTYGQNGRGLADEIKATKVEREHVAGLTTPIAVFTLCLVLSLCLVLLLDLEFNILR